MTAEINPETILDWSAPKRVQTKLGDRILRKAQPTDDFRAAFGSSKNPGPAYQQFRALGIGWSKDQDGTWCICWWQQIPQEEREHAAKMVEASRATDAQVDLPRPDGLNYMPFQRAGIAFALDALKQRKGVLIGDEMGLGKTIQAIGIINARPDIKRVLVIGPASLKLNWARELKKWSVRKMTVGIANTKCIPSTDIVILNYDIAATLRNHLERTEWDLLVCDEIHLLKNPEAQRTKAIFGYEPRRKQVTDLLDKHHVKYKLSEYRQALETAIAKGIIHPRNNPEVKPMPARIRLGLSGTPLVNTPSELWPILRWIDPGEWDSKWKFLNRYCGATKNGWGSTFDGAENLDELQQRLRSTCMVRRMKKDVLTELPPKRRQVIELPSNGLTSLINKERETHEHWENEIAGLRARIELTKASEDNDGYAEAVEALGEAIKVSFEQCGRLAHEVALAKVPYLVDHVAESAAEGKVILFAHHLDVIAKYVAEFDAMGFCPLKITGEVAVEDRQGIVDAFQSNPKHKVIVCGIHAAGVGLTLTASSHVIFAELDWVPANMMQAEDRAHRIGQRDSVLVQHMVMEGSIDVRQANALVRKMDIIDQTLDRKHAPRPEQSYQPAPDEREAKAERFGGDAVKGRREDYEREAKTITPEQTEAVHQGLRMLAGMCDGALQLDGAGFSKVDAGIGHSLAEQGRLSPRQAALGRRLVTKYRRQLPDSLVVEAGGKLAKEVAE